MSTIVVQALTPDEFFKYQLEFEGSNFLQSEAYFNLISEKNSSNTISCYGIFEGAEIIGVFRAAIMRKYRFFTEVEINYGPLMNYSMPVEKLIDVVAAIKDFFQDKGVAQLTVSPYLFERYRDEDLNIIRDNLYTYVIDAFRDNKFIYSGVLSTNIPVVYQIFVKDLSGYENEEALLNSISARTRRRIKKNIRDNIIIEEYQLQNLDEFYEIIRASGDRKGFYIQDKNYFFNLKKYFGNSVHFLIAKMDFVEYIEKLSIEIEKMNKKLDGLRSKEQSDKTLNKISSIEQNIEDYENKKKRLKEFAPESGEPAILSAGVFIEYADEIIYFIGGSKEEYVRYGGTISLFWHMMKLAINKNYKRFNFYGTIEVEEAEQNSGNYYFKKQFGGELINLIGRFTYTYSKLFAIISRIKNN